MTPALLQPLIPRTGAPVRRPFGNRMCDVATAGTEA